MALTVGTNSWVTVAEADTFFSEKWTASAWASLSDSEKESLLISAYRWIQQQLFFSISPASTADIVKQAQMEAAWYMYNFWVEHEKRRALYIQGVTKFKISKFSEDLQGVQFPEFIKAMLDDYIVNLGGKFPIISRTFDNNQ